MKIIPVGEFKTNFSAIIKEIIAGKEVGISYGRKKETVAILIPYSKHIKAKKRKFGLLSKRKGFKIKTDFEMSDSEIFGF